MKYRLVSVDSAVLGEPVLSLDEVDAAGDIAAVEAAYVREHAPAFVSCRVPLDDLPAILAIQAAGFRFIETQLKTEVEPRRVFDTSAYPYRFERVVSETDLDALIAIAGAGIRHDRLSIDPEIPRWYSAARYEAYIRQSFDSPDDEVWHLRHEATGKAVAFRTFRRMADGSVLLLLEAVSPAVPTVGVGMIATQFFLSDMCDRGVPSLITHASVINLPEFALEFTGFGFRLVKAFAVLRKIYRPIVGLVPPRPEPHAPFPRRRADPPASV